MSAEPSPTELPRASGLGLALFAVYLVLYGGFIALCAFNLEWMGRKGPLGLNHATLYGFGLIVAAFVLALIYMAAARHGAEERAS
jgi:uncharacterized membrane protein (DUF485 family)